MNLPTIASYFRNFFVLEAPLAYYSAGKEFDTSSHNALNIWSIH